MDEDLTAWIGKAQTRVDRIDPVRTNTLLTALGRDAGLKDGDALPALHHWLYFWEVRPPEGLGPDGHARRGGFLPPVPLPRRMWAGGEVVFHKPLRIGDAATNVSTIKAVQHKSGRSGDLVFVTVEHAVSGSEGVALVEQQDLVYRAPPAPGGGKPAAGEPLPASAWSQTVQADSVLLFRYSALTMNGHRIHYDHPYATGEEGYAGLVIHGPLQATLMLDMAQRALGGPLASFKFRGQSPACDDAVLEVQGAPAEGGASLWTAQGGRLCMSATAVLKTA